MEEYSTKIIVAALAFVLGVVVAFYLSGGRIRRRKLDRTKTKSKRIKEFHKEYEETCSSWFDAVIRECDIKPYTQASVNMHRLFAHYRAKNFASAIKMMQ